MNIEEVINNKSERIERKIILSKGQSNFFKYNISELGFARSYEDRDVSSIYFDDKDLSSLRDNIDGNRNRNKLRARYYNKNINKWFIEIKQKRGFIGYKHRINTPCNVSNELDLIDYMNRWSKNELNINCFPVSKIMYTRSYFQKGQFRATIDVNVNSYRLSSFGLKLHSSINDYEVIEFKYHSHDDEEFRTIFGQLNRNYVRATKSSKYSNSMMF